MTAASSAGTTVSKRSWVYCVWLSAIASLGLASLGCDGDLPHENGVQWPCRVEAERGGLIVGSHPEDGALWVCANANVDPSAVRSQCESDCEDKWCTYGVTSSFPYITFCTDATCRVVGDNPSPTGIECEEGSDPGGPARASLNVAGEGVVTANGNSGNASNVTGILRYSIAECGANACPIHFAHIDLDVPAFDLDGHTVRARIHNGVNPVGIWYADTKQFEFAPGALRIGVNFTVDGDGGSVALSNTSTVGGVLDPDGDQLSLSAVFSEDDVTVNITSLTGVHSNRSPTAVIQPESPVECNEPLAAAVTLDGSGSTDPDDNIERYEWRVNSSDVGNGSTLPFVLDFGASDVELTVYDSLSAFDKDEKTLDVIDTSPPSLTPPADVEAECESPDGTAVDIGQASAADTCDENISVSNDGLPLYPLGDTPVTWSAEDFSGNVAQAVQTVSIVDTTPPTLTLSVSPDTLWSPNHELVSISAAIVVTDICDPAPTVKLVSITSNEPDDALGDGNTDADIQSAAFGTDDRSFELRAERQGGGSGRVYTISYEAMDASGNTTLGQATVTVPHSKKK